MPYDQRQPPYGMHFPSQLGHPRQRVITSYSIHYTKLYESDDLSYRHALEAAKRDIVRKALEYTNGNHAAAARVLGVHKTHLLDLIKSLGLE